MSTVVSQEQADSSGGFPAGLAYTAYAAYRFAAPLPGRAHVDIASDAERALTDGTGVAIRGTYDTSGLRADCDLLFWLAGPTPESLQHAQASLRRTELGGSLEPFWQAVGVHREAEFSKSHVPAFFAGEPPRRWLCAYPFVRTAEWYLLDPDQAEVTADRARPDGPRLPRRACQHGQRVRPGGLRVASRVRG